MATLEKIRNKSVLLFVIIIVALLAFILGDFLTSGRTYFGSPTTVAKADGVSVEYQDYSNRISQLSDQYRNSGANLTSDQLSAMALNQLLAEGLENQEFRKLGITVTDAELASAVSGDNQTPQNAQIIAYLSQAIGLQQPSAAGVYDAIQNPARYNISAQDADLIKNQWQAMERQTESELLQQKFGRLVFPLFTYNKLDAQSTYDNVAETRQVSYVLADGATISDQDVNFSDADVTALWNERKNEYRLDEPTRLVDYIYVALEPTAADKSRAAAEVNEALAALNASEGTDAVSANPNFMVQTAKIPASRVNDPALKTFLTEAAPGAADQISSTEAGYTLAKLNAVTNEVDSITLSFVNFQDAALADSIVAALNSGKTAAELSDGATIAGADSVVESLLNPSITPEIVQFLLNAPIGTAVAYSQEVNSTSQANSVFKVVRRSAPVPVYDFALITYDVEPSAESLADYAAGLRTYISNNSSAADFSANAANNGYVVQSADVTPSSIAVGRANDRQWVKWAMEAKKGKVSPVFQDDKQTYLVAMAVKDVYGDFRPATDPTVYPRLESEARNSKKAAQLVENFKGKANSLDEYASLMGATVNNGSVNFTSPVLLNVGMRESALQGAIAAAAEGQLVGPVQGNRGAMVFTVTGVDSSNRPFTEEEYGQTFLRNFSPLRGNNQLALLLGNKKIDNRSLNFVNAPAE